MIEDYCDHIKKSKNGEKLFYEVLRKARLAKARRLLETRSMSVSEVAYEVGFSAPSYFTKCFKEEYGMLPGDVGNVMK